MADTFKAYDETDRSDIILWPLTPIEDFNGHFESKLSNEEFDTIGGLVIHALPSHRSTPSVPFAQPQCPTMI